ncbi:hypothetical protein F5Y07DRAFT_410120 [Xylaria sp. FL0933]|nr:hypothetical protein F5Y07DRAFT_410120 [Xylaria sp. FL0933]
MVEASKAWRKPGGIFAPQYRQVGFLHCVSEGAPKKAFTTVQSFWASAKRHPEMSTCLAPPNSRADILREVWQFEDGALPRWKGTSTVTTATRTRATLCRPSTMPAPRLAAKLVIVATGVAAGTLVPGLGTQLVAKSWSVAHVKLTDKEAALLRSIPVTYSRSAGFMVEPDVGTNLLKLCPMGGGEFMPAQDEARCRTLLAQTLPWLTNRPLINKTLCWFADTADSDFFID